MPLRTIPVRDITPADLQRLVDEEKIEDKRIDYKQDLSQNKEDARALLEDISAMANTFGGDILIGVREQRDAKGQPTGLPEALAGVSVPNWDAVRRRLASTIQDTIEPRLQGIEIEKIDLVTGNAIIIIRVPPSMQAPHLITSRPGFYSRGEGKNNPMDINEIRQAFLQQASMRERADGWRRTRVQEVINGVVPVELEYNAPTFPKALTFLHVIPLGAQPYSVDLTNPHIRQYIDGLFPIAAKAFPHNKLTSRLNFDGQVNFSLSGSSPGRAMSYVQVFRNGAIEFCNANIIRPYGNSLVCYGTELDQHLLDGLHRTLQLYEQLILPLPYAVFATVKGVKNAHVYAGPYDPSIAFDQSNTIDRDQLFPSGQLIEQRDDKPEQVLKPILDAIWNASGHVRSFSYDEAGSWIRDPS